MQTFSHIPGDKLECLVCPHLCKLQKGKRGICGVRENTGDKIELITYGMVSGYALDPIEKKPLYHFYPGHNILSVGSYGCNMRCDFCQNYDISQKIPDSLIRNITPEKIIESALSSYRNIGVAFTYNEPIVWFEFMRDIAFAAKERGLFTVMVSNGFVTSGILDEIIKFTDAFNIDLKAFNSTFYRKITGADIEPVKKGLKQIAKSGKHLEITTLIIPGQNENEDEMNSEAEWIAGELGSDIPLHLSRYYPSYKRDDPAPSQKNLDSLFETASRHLDFVYQGNTRSDSGQNTICPECNTINTIRSGYITRLSAIDDHGRCTECGHLIYRHFILPERTNH